MKTQVRSSRESDPKQHAPPLGPLHQPPEVNYIPCFENDELPCRLHVFHVVCRANHRFRNRVNSSLQVVGGCLSCSLSPPAMAGRRGRSVTAFSRARRSVTNNFLSRVLALSRSFARSLSQRAPLRQLSLARALSLSRSLARALSASPRLPHGPESEKRRTIQRAPYLRLT